MTYKAVRRLGCVSAARTTQEEPHKNHTRRTTQEPHKSTGCRIDRNTSVAFARFVAQEKSRITEYLISHSRKVSCLCKVRQRRGLVVQNCRIAELQNCRIADCFSAMLHCDTVFRTFRKKKRGASRKRQKDPAGVQELAPTDHLATSSLDPRSWATSLPEVRSKRRNLDPSSRL